MLLALLLVDASAPRVIAGAAGALMGAAVWGTWATTRTSGRPARR